MKKEKKMEENCRDSNEPQNQAIITIRAGKSQCTPAKKKRGRGGVGTKERDRKAEAHFHNTAMY